MLVKERIPPGAFPSRKDSSTQTKQPSRRLLGGAYSDTQLHRVPCSPECSSQPDGPDLHNKCSELTSAGTATDSKAGNSPRSQLTLPVTRTHLAAGPPTPPAAAPMPSSAGQARKSSETSRAVHTAVQTRGPGLCRLQQGHQQRHRWLLLPICSSQSQPELVPSSNGNTCGSSKRSAQHKEAGGQQGSKGETQWKVHLQLPVEALLSDQPQQRREHR